MAVSRAKVAAAVLLTQGSARTVEIAERLQQAGAWPQVGDRERKKTAETLRNMAALGLVERNAPVPGVVRPVNRNGLRRVIDVGLEQYAREQGRPRSSRTRNAR